MKRSILSLALLSLLSGCNTESESTVDQSRVVEVNTFIAPVMETKSYAIASTISYQHSPKLEGYTVEVNELGDADNYSGTGYIISDGAYDFPIKKSAQIVAYHDDQSSPTISGVVSSVYTYRALADVDDTQMSFPLEFTNDNWMYITAVFRKSDIANLSLVRLESTDGSDSVPMNLVEDETNGHYYYYGYVRGDAVIKFDHALYGSLESNITYTLSESENNAGKHGEFVVSDKEGNVEIIIPDWDKLPSNPPVELPVPTWFTDDKTVVDAKECLNKAYDKGANYYAVMKDNCRWDSTSEAGGIHTLDETVAASYTVASVPTPSISKERISDPNRNHTEEIDVDGSVEIKMVGKYFDDYAEYYPSYDQIIGESNGASLNDFDITGTFPTVKNTSGNTVLINTKAFIIKPGVGTVIISIVGEFNFDGSVNVTIIDTVGNSYTGNSLSDLPSMWQSIAADHMDATLDDNKTITLNSNEYETNFITNIQLREVGNSVIYEKDYVGVKYIGTPAN
ncbi:hypothetical protein A3K86_03365 [Photobacterium jeanii]|uniref:Uncharacterized protein n=1 Tax=Photobacterium jeanii TaxID=858640 RepID=A0A178KL49_9GAMM|nr:hypothetical protein [Photobacterium jeanii]OAN17971.1 hypothetical protein A3K86_03365 [Photobacterium jeanii]PST92359.1 hypothetical protein C9I91_04080 [Photobacterium jeanii]